MALTDDLPGLGALGSVGAVAADLVLNSGEIVLSLAALLLSSPDVWLTILTGMRRIASLAGVSTAWFEPLIVAATVLMILFSIERLIDRWRSDT